jgi:hypothetical protein
MLQAADDARHAALLAQLRTVIGAIAVVARDERRRDAGAQHLARAPAPLQIRARECGVLPDSEVSRVGLLFFDNALAEPVVAAAVWIARADLAVAVAADGVSGQAMPKAVLVVQRAARGELTQVAIGVRHRHRDVVLQLLQP